jgi:tRNA (guanine-N7-)-methyltransferase
LAVTLPRLAFPLSAAENPADAFAAPVRRLWLEVGFGGGEHAAVLASANPDAGLIACEVFENGICSLLSRLAPEGEEETAALPGNLRLWTEDARILLRALPAESLDALFLMFPDPWPKTRHAKRRFVHPANLEMVKRVLKPDGVWRIATDDPTYQAWTQETLKLLPLPERPDDWPHTRYEAKAHREGRTPQYWEVKRESVVLS